MAAPTGPQSKAFRSEIARLNQASVAAFNRGDMAACAGFYGEDATMLVPARPPIEGRAAIRDYLEGMSASGVTMLPANPSTILSNGDLGCCAGTYAFRQPAGRGMAQAATGKFVTVVRRAPDGSWKVAVDCFFADIEAGADPELPAVGPARRTTQDGDRARDEVRAIYDKGARYYDPTVWLYYLAGMRIGRWRRKGIEALALRPGDTVVEIGCGTGLNFPLLQQAVGSKGKIIGIDISEAMLERARRRVRDAGWQNVELIRCAAADFEFPDGIAGILATGVLNYEPAYDRVIEKGAKALAHGSRWVIFDYKKPKTWLRHLVPLFVFLGSGFGVSRERMERRPWESMQHYLRNTRMEEYYGGFVYIMSGEAL